MSPPARKPSRPDGARRRARPARPARRGCAPDRRSRWRGRPGTTATRAAHHGPASDASAHRQLVTESTTPSSHHDDSPFPTRLPTLTTSPNTTACSFYFSFFIFIFITVPSLLAAAPPPAFPASRLGCPARFIWQVEEGPSSAKRWTALPRKPRRDAGSRAGGGAPAWFPRRRNHLRRTTYRNQVAHAPGRTETAAESTPRPCA